MDSFGFNKYGCNAANLDRWGKPCDTDVLKHLGVFGADGFNAEHCNRQGLDESGALCKGAVIGADGLDKFGFNAANCNASNIDRWGKPCDFKATLDEFGAGNCSPDHVNRSGKPCGAPTYDPLTGFSQYGVNRLGCSTKGKTSGGKVCDPNAVWGTSGIGVDGRDKMGYDAKTGLDPDGFSRIGYDVGSLDRSRCGKDGKTPLGFNCITGLNDAGFDENGCSAEGRTIGGLPCIHVSFKPKWGADGYNANGVNKLGFNELSGLNSSGVDVDGVRPNGMDRLNCDPITKLNSSGYSCITGLNADGVDIDGYDANGMKDGLDRSGKDADGYGADGFNDAGFDKQHCNRSGEHADGTQCSNEIDYHLTDPEKALMLNYVKDQGTLEAMMFADAEVVSTPKMEIGVPETKPIKADSAVKRPISSASETSIKNESAHDGVKQQVRVPAYTLLRGEVTCDMDSDYKGDACVKIIGGALSGARLYGSFSVPNIDKVEMDRDKIKIHYDTMIWKRKTYKVDADAVNSESMSKYLGSSVDYHYVFRWGGLLMGTAFDLSKALLIGNSAAKTDGAASASMILNGAAAQPFDEMSALYHKRMVRRPTVRMYRGEDVGVLFKKQLVNKDFPYLF